MEWSTRDFTNGVDSRLEARLDSLRRWNQPEVEDFIDTVTALAAGGKRTRARLVRAGMLATLPEPSCADMVAAVRLGAAVELFQLAALIHDDIIDASATRRGVPTVHAELENYHRVSGWDGSPERYGFRSGLIVGDAVLALASQEAVSAGRSAPLEPFFTMCEDVGIGQFLDIRCEYTRAATREDISAIITHKTVSYSALFPLLIGAALAEQPAPETIADLQAFATPFGEAFQLRDDILGIFGDPAITGKPAGDDLTEGKNTFLFLETLERVSEVDARWLRSLRGKRLEGDDVVRAQALMEDSGARAHVENMIRQREDRARAILPRLNEAARDSLGELLQRLRSRTH